MLSLTEILCISNMVDSKYFFNLSVALMAMKIKNNLNQLQAKQGHWSTLKTNFKVWKLVYYTTVNTLIVIWFTHRAPRSYKNSSRNVCSLKDRIGIWKCWFLRRGENQSIQGKTSRSRIENQQQTQSTYDARSGNRTCDTLMEGEHSDHCATPAPQTRVNIYLHKVRHYKQFPVKSEGKKNIMKKLSCLSQTRTTLYCIMPVHTK